MFAECGSWKNFHELEDELTLEELGELNAEVVERQNRMFRFMAMAMGADIDEGPSSTSSIPMSSEEAERSGGQFLGGPQMVSGAEEAALISSIVGGGLGYETIQGEN